MSLEPANNSEIYSELNSEEVQEFISEVPAWIVRRGITLILALILSFLVASAFIQYPDVVKTGLKINSLNAPKVVYAKQTGKIVSLLIKEGTWVKQGTSLAFMESTASHPDVLKLHDELISIQKTLNGTGIPKGTMLSGLNLGELQSAYQNFYQQYLQYMSTQNDGYYLNRRKYLEKDLQEIGKLKERIMIQQKIQNRELNNNEQEFASYQKLYQKKVISTSEFKSQENKYLAAKYPLEQTATAMINNTTAYLSKQKEILDLDHTVQDEKAKFTQSLSNLLTETNAWINLYVLSAPVNGIVSYASIVQENKTVAASEELFIVNPSNTDFFGEVYIPQYNMGRVRTGQRTLIKMKSYPFEQYGLIRGRVSYISDAAIKDSVFIAKIAFEKFENKDPQHKIVLKNGMQAEVEIVTEESSLLNRFTRNIKKMLNSN